MKVYLVIKSFLDNFALVTWLCGENKYKENDFYFSPFVILRKGGKIGHTFSKSQLSIQVPPTFMRS